jgi:hypothetical protein
MTVETKTTIQLSDVTTIEFECVKCHMVSSYPLDIALHPQGSCVNGCGEWMPFGGDTYRSLTHLIELMKRFAKATNEPYIMRFGITTASTLDRASGEKD